MSANGRLPRRCGDYELVDLLGRGGMGEVWRAYQSALGRHAAVKLIRTEMLKDGDERSLELRRRFEREIKATASLTSPHSVRIFDCGVSDDGFFYYAMELLDGLSLRAMVERHGPVPASRAVHLLVQACESLAEAHHRGLVHRDVKPANICACRVGLQTDFVKVLDFGLAKGTVGIGLGDSQLTADGTALGSPAFMPPEVASGQHAVGPLADIYALGCVAYWLVTGKLVFEGETGLQMILKHVQVPPEPPSRRVGRRLPGGLERVILRCLEKRPEDRPQGARELAGALRAAELDDEEAWTAERADAWWATVPTPTPAPVASVLAASALAPTGSTASLESPESPPALGKAPASEPAGVAPPAAPAVTRPVAKKAMIVERERAVVELQEQFVQSHIDATELGRRIERVERASSTGEIRALFADLPAPAGATTVEAAPQAAAGHSSRVLATVQPEGERVPTLSRSSRDLIAVFGGRSVAGHWRPPSLVNMVCVFGGIQLDLRHAELLPGCTTLKVVAVFGGGEIIVPPGLYFEVDGIGIFGGFDEGAPVAEPPADQETPWLRITGVALFGGLAVKVAKEGGATRDSFRRDRRRRAPQLPPATPQNGEVDRGD
ncbi:MAG: protein kinase [Pseudomonadota bacterium]